MVCKLLRILQEATGSTATEYAVIAFLISIGIIGAASFIGLALPAPFTVAAAAL
jgi:Flp pilus assembly pilin Flp